MRIALVEDNSEQRDYLSKLVTAWLQDHDPGGQVVTYPDSKSFLFAREDLAFDLLLLDIILPDINGMDLARQLRQEQDLVPIAFLTGEVSFVFDGYKVSAVDYLLKPVGQAELSRVLSKALTLAQERQLELVFATEDGLISRPLSQVMYAEAQGKYLEVHVYQHPQTTEIIRIRESLEAWGQAWPQAQANFAMNDLGQVGREQTSSAAAARGSGGQGELRQLGENKSLANQVDILVQPHRSYLVNLRWLAKLSSSALTMADGSVIPLARGRRQEVQAQYLAWCRRKAGPATL